MGERVFGSWLTENKLPFRWLNEQSEAHLPYDFEVTLPSGRVVTIDVKTAGPSQPLPVCAQKLAVWSYEYPVSSKPTAKDFVVLVYVWESTRTSGIVGFISAKDVAACPVSVKPVDGRAQKFEIANHTIRPIREKFHSISGPLSH